jgi:hypothetical protein
MISRPLALATSKHSMKSCGGCPTSSLWRPKLTIPRSRIRTANSAMTIAACGPSITRSTAAMNRTVMPCSAEAFSKTSRTISHTPSMSRQISTYCPARAQLEVHRTVGDAVGADLAGQAFPVRPFPQGDHRCMAGLAECREVAESADHRYFHVVLVGQIDERRWAHPEFEIEMTMRLRKGPQIAHQLSTRRSGLNRARIGVSMMRAEPRPSHPERRCASLRTAEYHSCVRYVQRAEFLTNSSSGNPASLSPP